MKTVPKFDPRSATCWMRTIQMLTMYSVTWYLKIRRLYRKLEHESKQKMFLLEKPIQVRGYVGGSKYISPLKVQNTKTYNCVMSRWHPTCLTRDLCRRDIASVWLLFLCNIPTTSRIDYNMFSSLLSLMRINTGLPPKRRRRRWWQKGRNNSRITTRKTFQSPHRMMMMKQWWKVCWCRCCRSA